MDRKPNAWRAVPKKHLIMYKTGNFSEIEGTTYLNGENNLDENGNQKNNYYTQNPTTGEVVSKYERGKKYLHFYPSAQHAKEFAEDCARDSEEEYVVLAFELPKELISPSYKGKYRDRYGNPFANEMREEYIIGLEQYSREFYIREGQPGDYPKIPYDPDKDSYGW